MADPECLIIACCGHSVERTIVDIAVLRDYPGFSGLRCVKNGQIFVADGSAHFNRPGPRLVDSLEQLAHAIDPTIHLVPSGLEPLLRYQDIPV